MFLLLADTKIWLNNNKHFLSYHLIHICVIETKKTRTHQMCITI